MEHVEFVMKLGAFILLVGALSKAITYNLSLRVEKLEKVKFRTVKDCTELMSNCTIYTHVCYIKKAIDDLHKEQKEFRSEMLAERKAFKEEMVAWIQRVEDKAK